MSLLPEKVYVGKFTKILKYKDPKTNEDVVKKYIYRNKMTESQLTKLEWDAELMLCNLDHPHIVKVHAYYLSKNQAFIVMKYMPLGNLYEHTHHQKLKPSKALHYVIQIAKALDYCHHKNIIHRDVKEENILLGDNDVVTLTDFGFATTKLCNYSKAPILGTVGYMSPEMMFKYGYDTRTDIWSLGIVLFSLLFGQDPFCKLKTLMDFEHLDMEFCIDQKINKNTEIILPPSVKDIVSKMLKETPKERLILQQLCILGQVYISANRKHSIIL